MNGGIDEAEHVPEKLSSVFNVFSENLTERHDEETALKKYIVYSRFAPTNIARYQTVVPLGTLEQKATNLQAKIPHSLLEFFNNCFLPFTWYTALIFFYSLIFFLPKKNNLLAKNYYLNINNYFY